MVRRRRCWWSAHTVDAQPRRSGDPCLRAPHYAQPVTDDPPENRPEFDPARYLEIITPAHVRKMTLREVIELEHNSDKLSPEQQRSFAHSKAEVLGPAINAIKDSFSTNWSAPPAMQLLSPDVLASLNTVSSRISRQARLASRIQPDVQFTRDVTIAAPAATATAMAPAPVISTTEDDAELEESTVGEFEREVDRDAEMLAVLRSMATMMAEERLSATRGKFFAAIVSMAVIVAGVASVVAADDWTQRIWIIGISTGLAILAVVAYRFTLWRQSNST